MKFGDSESNGFRDIRGADVVSNERTNMTKSIPIARKAFKIGVSRLVIETFMNGLKGDMLR